MTSWGKTNSITLQTVWGPIEGYRQYLNHVLQIINLYYSTYQALPLFCPIKERWSLTLTNIYHTILQSFHRIVLLYQLPVFAIWPYGTIQKRHHKIFDIFDPPPSSITLFCPRPYALKSHFALPPPPPCMTLFMNGPYKISKFQICFNYSVYCVFTY